MAEPTPHVSLRAVTKVFPPIGSHAQVHALGPVDLDIVRGEFFSVVGPSGCGKSTFLDILAGLSSATEGQASFDGAPLHGVVPDGVGAVFQQDASFAWLTVWDNVAFGLRRRGAGKAEVQRRVDHAVRFMGLAGFAHAYPAQLSGGMRSRRFRQRSSPATCSTASRSMSRLMPRAGSSAAPGVLPMAA